MVSLGTNHRNGLANFYTKAYLLLLHALFCHQELHPVQGSLAKKAEFHGQGNSKTVEYYCLCFAQLTLLYFYLEHFSTSLEGIIALYYSISLKLGQLSASC